VGIKVSGQVAGLARRWGDLRTVAILLAELKQPILAVFYKALRVCRKVVDNGGNCFALALN